MSSTTDQQRLQEAVRHHASGRVREAAGIYQELLGKSPRDPDLMQRLGVALAQLGNPADGAHWLAASLELKPDRPSVLLNLARTLLALGRAQDALSCCDRAVLIESANIDAYRGRAAALMALGRIDDALANFGQAVRLAPRDPGALIDLAGALAVSGRTQGAIDCLNLAINIDPSQPAAFAQRAALSVQQSDHERALADYDRALALRPHDAGLHNDRANSLKELGRLAEAIEGYSTALAIEPGNPATLHNRAVAASLAGRHAEAIRDYDRLSALQPENPADLIGRGAALVALGRYAEALAPLTRASELLPQDAEPYIQKGVALMRLERHADALASFDRALAIRPDDAAVLNNRGIARAALDQYDAALEDMIRSSVLDGDVDTHTNIGVLFKRIGRYSEAALSFDRALSRRRDDPAAQFELGFLRLTLGEFRTGWPLYEARFRVPALAIPARDFGMPRWSGAESLQGKTILVHAEQGLGDAIQFCRYIPLLQRRGAAVVLEVPAALKALMRTLSEAVQVVGRGEQLPKADFHCPLLSLPLAFGTVLETIPHEVPYLSADPSRVAEWRQKLRDADGFRIGIAWQGNAQVERLIWARGRSIPLSELAPLANIPGVQLISLQKGFGQEQLAAVPFAARVLDLSSQLDLTGDAFLDTAAVMANLDLIIASDTSVAHLAGALARPVWVALSTSADWRWLLERGDSPWYPTARLFRQTRAGEWNTVVEPMARELRARLPSQSG